MPPKPKTVPPRLRHIANLWSLWDYPGAKNEWRLEKKISAIKLAGFDGFTTLLDRNHGRLAKKHGLCTIGYISSAKPSEFRGLVERNLEGGALRINVQLGSHHTPVKKAAAMAVQIIEEGRRQGVPCDIEVHRDTCTETPEKTYAIAAAYQKATGELMPLTWDFSHLAVVKHLAAPYWERLLVAPKLIQNSRQFHFRPFNGHHAQIPVTDKTGELSVEFRQWLPFLEKTLEIYLKGRHFGEEVFFCPEMGPVRGGYNLAQLPNSWEDAQILRQIIDRVWQKALSPVG